MQSVQIFSVVVVGADVVVFGRLIGEPTQQCARPRPSQHLAAQCHLQYGNRSMMFRVQLKAGPLRLQQAV